jgi:hypothetical protein
MLGPWIAAALLLAAAVCLARIRLALRVEIWETGAAAYAGVRLAGFIPAGTLGLEMRTGETPTLTLSWRIFKARLRATLDMMRFREIAGRRGPALRQWLSPALNGDVLRRAFRVQSLRIDVRDLFAPLDALCVWAGAERALRSLAGLIGVRFAVGFWREKGAVLKIQSDLVMNPFQMSRITFRNLRKKVRSWNSTPLKTSCSRP